MFQPSYRSFGGYGYQLMRSNLGRVSPSNIACLKWRSFGPWPHYCSTNERLATCWKTYKYEYHCFAWHHLPGRIAISEGGVEVMLFIWASKKIAAFVDCVHFTHFEDPEIKRNSFEKKIDMPKNSISRESVKKNDWNENLCSKIVWEIWFGNKNREGGPTIQWGFLHAPQTNYQFTLHSTNIATKIILS